MKKNNMNKSEKYAVLIQEQISAMFQDDSENYINPDELLEGNNATDFLHALANIVPCSVYNRLTGEENNLLEFNHIANRLVFQNIKIKDE
jgi:hypothetical protein